MTYVMNMKVLCMFVTSVIKCHSLMTCLIVRWLVLTLAVMKPFFNFKFN